MHFTRLSVKKCSIAKKIIRHEGGIKDAAEQKSTEHLRIIHLKHQCERGEHSASLNKCYFTLVFRLNAYSYYWSDMLKCTSTEVMWQSCGEQVLKKLNCSML